MGRLRRRRVKISGCHSVSLEYFFDHQKLLACLGGFGGGGSDNPSILLSSVINHGTRGGGTRTRGLARDRERERKSHGTLLINYELALVARSLGLEQTKATLGITHSLTHSLVGLLICGRWRMNRETRNYRGALNGNSIWCSGISRGTLRGNTEGTRGGVPVSSVSG